MLRDVWNRSSWLIVFLITVAGSANAQENLQTPLEKAQFSRISRSSEISVFLNAIAAATPGARKEVLGLSVKGRPIEALTFSSNRPNAMTLMVIGSQHGSAEPAGGEALLVIARDIAAGNLRPLLDSINIILIPNANPDGRDIGKRANANGININTDFVLATQPETRAILQALNRFSPDVLLDAHESAVLKRKTLAKENYLTDFNAQFEVANNPAIPRVMRQFTLGNLLPTLTSRVSSAGLPTHRYIGEITHLAQPITNGGLTLNNLRNTAGMYGAVSFLVETKLEPRENSYPTYRNIAERINRQLLCIRHFIHLIHERRDEIITTLTTTRAVLQTEPVPLYARYALDKAHPHIEIPMRKLPTGALEKIEFQDFRRVETADVIPLPNQMLITAHIDEMKQILDSHFIRYDIIEKPKSSIATANRYSFKDNDPAQLIESKTKAIYAPRGSLVIDLAQSKGRLALMLMDPRSTSSIFRFPQFSKLLDTKRETFIYLIYKGAKDGK